MIKGLEQINLPQRLDKFKSNNHVASQDIRHFKRYAALASVRTVVRNAAATQ